jgi:hypothetical protein
MWQSYAKPRPCGEGRGGGPGSGRRGGGVTTAWHESPGDAVSRPTSRTGRRNSASWGSLIRGCPCNLALLRVPCWTEGRCSATCSKCPRVVLSESVRPATSCAALASGRCKSGYRTPQRPASRPKLPGRRGCWRSGKQAPPAARRWPSGMRSLPRRGTTSPSDHTARRSDHRRPARRCRQAASRPSDPGRPFRRSFDRRCAAAHQHAARPAIGAGYHRTATSDRTAAALASHDLTAAVRATPQTWPSDWVRRCRNFARGDAPSRTSARDRMTGMTRIVTSA